MRNTGPDKLTVLRVQTRTFGACLRCCDAFGEQIHHRKPRGMGGTRDPKINDATNLVWICAECHRDIESRRKDAYRDGWLVARTADPAQQPLITPGRQMIMLLTDGGMEVNQLPADYTEPPF